MTYLDKVKEAIAHHGGEATLDEIYAYIKSNFGYRLPTKPEQSDLLAAIYGRHGEAPMPVIAAQSASDCFNMTIEAARIALKYMTPVILLTDGYLGQGSEPWRVPDEDEYPDKDR